MAKFLTTTGISYHIEDIIKNAKKYIILLSPYLKLSPNLYHRLLEAASNDVTIYIIYGKKELSGDELDKLASIKNLNLFYLENLHAKCYFNESNMIISSMNIYEFSEKNNREMGILLSKPKDEEIINETLNEVGSIIYFAEALTIIDEEPSNEDKINEIKKEIMGIHGHCIRCGKIIDWAQEANDLFWPFCKDCEPQDKLDSYYETWEGYCHKCGNKAFTNPENSICYICRLKSSNDDITRGKE